MNKLEEYKLKTFPIKNGIPIYIYQHEGFDAAIALDLPVKFAEWLDTSEYVSKYYSFNRIKLEPKMNGSHIKKQEEARKELYQYWLDNVYNP